VGVKKGCSTLHRILATFGANLKSNFSKPNSQIQSHDRHETDVSEFRQKRKEIKAGDLIVLNTHICSDQMDNVKVHAM
jgi:hypothetical protein